MEGASERGRILVCRYGILRTAPTILVNHWSRRPDFMRPGAEIPIIHPRTWNIPISPWSRSDWTLSVQVFRKYKCTCSREDYFFSLFFFIRVFFRVSRRIRSLISVPALPTLSNREARKYIRWSRVHAVSRTRSLIGAARKFIADLFLQIWREIDKYSS